MEVFPILVDGEEIDTGEYTIFPDMEKVIKDPGLAIALQMQNASSFSRFVFSKVPGSYVIIENIMGFQNIRRMKLMKLHMQKFPFLGKKILKERFLLVYETITNCTILSRYLTWV